MIFLVFYIIGLLAGIVAVIKKKQQSAADIAETMLLYQLTVTVSLSSMIGFIGHVFMSEQIAAQIGLIRNFNPLNVFPAITDILIPLTLITCWLLKTKQKVSREML